MISPISYLPTPLPDEHILSVLARWHELSGHVDFKRSAALFTSNRHRLNNRSIWFPAYADIYKHFNGALSRYELLNQHTLYAYYAPFLTNQVRCAIEIGSQHTNEPEQRFAPEHQVNVRYSSVWRWCPDCIEDDIEEYGSQYWHCLHQVPTIRHCQKHGTILRYHCENCDFEYLNLSKIWLPPEKDQCPLCHQPYPLSIKLSSPDEIHWLEEISNHLQANISKGSIENLREILKIAFGSEDRPRNFTVTLRRQLSAVQAQFDSAYSKRQLTVYLNGIESSLNARKTPRFLNVSHIAYGNSCLPPLCYLLLLHCFFSVQELENIFWPK